VIDFPKINFNLNGIFSPQKTSSLEGMGIDGKSMPSSLPDQAKDYEDYIEVVKGVLVRSSGNINFEELVNGELFFKADSKLMAGPDAVKNALDLITKLMGS